MKEILETIILNLVDNKEQVTINSREEERATVFEVKSSRLRYGKSNWKTRKNCKKQFVLL